MTEFANILDVSGMTKAELSEYIIQLENESLDCSTQEQAIKLIINSIYGAFANEYFHFFNLNIAEAITLQGQDAIKYSEKCVQRYFKDFWPTDYKLHKILGLDNDKPLPSMKESVWIYTDTDSGYLVFNEAMKAVNWSGGIIDFILKLNEYRLGPYLNKCFEIYANKHNSENFLNFELETIATNGIWVAKKKYVQNIIWKDGKHYDNLSSIKAKGLELIQSSTPSFARKKLKDLVSWIFAQDELRSDKLIGVLKDIKDEFKMANIEDISANRSISNYKKYIIDDKTEFQIASKCPFHVRAGGYYNYLLNNSKYKNKYQLITSGQKIRFYHTDDPFCNVFAYIAGDYPYEFAAQISYEKQFEKFILEPLNRIIVPSGLPQLNRNLVYTTALF